MKIWHIVGGVLAVWVASAYAVCDEDIAEAVRTRNWVYCSSLPCVEDTVFALRCAIESNDLELIKLIYDNIARNLRSHHINFRLPHTGHALSDYTLLAVAVAKKRAKIVRWLIKHGADATVQMADGKTALMIALRLGYYGITRDLIKTGSGVDAVDNQGRTAFVYALSRYSDDPKTLTKIIKALVDKNACIAPEHYQDDHGFCLCDGEEREVMNIVRDHPVLKDKSVFTFLQNSIRFLGEESDDGLGSFALQSEKNQDNDDNEQTLLLNRL